MNRRLVHLAAYFMLTLSLLLVGTGCDTLKGPTIANSVPTVEFVNIPPPGTTFSGGAFLFWVGRDIDGQVVQYRLAVVREFDMANLLGEPYPLDSAAVERFISNQLASLTDTVWDYLDVTPENPATSAILSLYADLTRPVLNKVQQFVFLQAFDEQGLGSKIIFRRLLRFDNPPLTQIFPIDRSNQPPYINSDRPGQLGGIRLSWRASDPIDFPAEAPPFEFEWKLFGPFTRADSALIIQSVKKKVFLANDGQVFIIGENPPDYVLCDTIPDADSLIIRCIVTDPDTVTQNSIYGRIDSIIDLQDPDWITTGFKDRVAASSGDSLNVWVRSTADSMFGVFRSAPTDSTIERKFIIWVRSRDDAKVPDPTPDYVMINVIEPKKERDIGVFNMRIAAAVTNGPSDSINKSYWDSVLTWYSANGGYPVLFDTGRDYYVFTDVVSRQSLLSAFLKYKTLILLHDESKGGAFSDGRFHSAIASSVNSGVNIWYIGRSLGKGSQTLLPPGNPPDNPVFSLESITPGANNAPWPGISNILGAISTQYTGWDWHLRAATGQYANLRGLRVENFIGTYSFDEVNYPSLEIDTFRLEKSYNWGLPGALAYRRTSDGTIINGALPEVNWFLRDFRTELIYLYRSSDTLSHPRGQNFFYNAKPIAFRWDRGTWRSATWGFNPMVMKQSEALTAIHTQLDWLFLPSLGGAAPTPSNLTTEERDLMYKLTQPKIPAEQRYQQ